MTLPQSPEGWDMTPAAEAVAGSLEWIEMLAGNLLQRLRLEAESGPTCPLPVSLDKETADALYAWAVVCYEQGQYGDAATLFGALARRMAPSPRLWRALGACHLACGEPARAAAAFQALNRLDLADADVIFFWAEAEYLQLHCDQAEGLLRRAQALAQARPEAWPGLMGWCDELLIQMKTPPSN